MTGGSNDVRTNLIRPVLGCLPLKTSSGDDDVMVCCVFGMGMIKHPIIEFMSLLTWSVILMRGQLGGPFCCSLQFLGGGCTSPFLWDASPAIPAPVGQRGNILVALMITTLFRFSASFCFLTRWWRSDVQRWCSIKKSIIVMSITIEFLFFKESWCQDETVSPTIDVKDFHH